jgi:hypothetical protein
MINRAFKTRLIVRGYEDRLVVRQYSYVLFLLDNQPFVNIILIDSFKIFVNH